MTTLAPAWLAVALLAAPPQTPTPPRVTARVAAAIDLDSGEVLFDKNATAPHAIASITKLLAVRVILGRDLDLEAETEMVPSDYENTKGGARSRLMTGHPYKHRDLLHAALLGSDNRAIVALGRAVGLEFDELVEAMNREARELGLTRTHFGDPTGIDHANTSTAAEVVAMLRAALEVPGLAEISRSKTWAASASERSGRPLVYRNTNLLVHDDIRQVLVGKTGFNSAAGWCVATAIRLKSGRRVGLVVLGTSGKYVRFRDAKRIEAWVAKLPYEPKPRPAPQQPGLPFPK